MSAAQGSQQDPTASPWVKPGSAGHSCHRGNKIIAFVCSRRSHGTAATPVSHRLAIFQVIARSLSSTSKILFSEVLHTTVDCLKSLEIRGDPPEPRAWPFKAHGHLCRTFSGNTKRTTWPANTERTVTWVVLMAKFYPKENSCVLPRLAGSRVPKAQLWLAVAGWRSPHRSGGHVCQFILANGEKEKRKPVFWFRHSGLTGEFVSTARWSPPRRVGITFILQA